MMFTSNFARVLIKFLSFSLMIFSLSGGQALGETIYGKVDHVDPQAKVVRLESAGKFRYVPKQITLLFNDGTDYEGLSSFTDLAEGDSIIVDAMRKDSKTWIVHTIAPLSERQKKTGRELAPELKGPAALESEPFLPARETKREKNNSNQKDKKPFTPFLSGLFL